MRLIDGDDLKDFFFRPESGTEETINDLMMKHNLDYLHDVNEDDVMDFAKELLHMVCNVIDTQQTAYDIDKVIGELDKQINIAKSEFNLTHDSILIVTISELQRARAIVKQQL